MYNFVNTPPCKIIFCVIAFLFSLRLFAQTVTVDESQPDGTFSPEYVFANLNFSVLQTGLLIDKAIPLAKIKGESRNTKKATCKNNHKTKFKTTSFSYFLGIQFQKHPKIPIL